MANVRITNENQLQALKFTETATQLPKFTANSEVITEEFDEVSVVDSVQIKNDKIIARIDETGVTDGLVGWWSFNNNLNDVSGNGNNGTFYGGASPNYQDAIPDGGKGILFDGINDYVDCGNNSSLDVFRTGGSKLLTISVWAKLNAPYIRSSFLSKGKSGEGFYFEAMVTTGLLRFTLLGVIDYYAKIAKITDTKYHHIVAVFDSGYDVSYYLDGVFIEKVNGDTVGRTSNEPVIIGDNFTHAYKIKGILDDVRIYNRALTDKEIKQLCRSFKQ